MNGQYDLMSLGWLVPVLAIVIGILWTRKEFKESHANFFFSISLKVKRMVKSIKDETQGTDTERLIEIFFYSFEEHLLYILQHHKFTQKRKLTDKDFARYNNMFYAQMSGVYMEWVINSIDDRLLSIFLEHQKSSIKTHMDHMREILSRHSSIKHRRELMANEFMEFLKNIEDNYQESYAQYERVLSGDMDYKQLMKIIRIREDDMTNIFNKLVNAMNNKEPINEEER